MYAKKKEKEDQHITMVLKKYSNGNAGILNPTLG